MRIFLFLYGNSRNGRKGCRNNVFLISRIFDGGNDPFIGCFIDKSPNSKFGKFRRTLIIGLLNNLIIRYASE